MKHNRPTDRDPLTFRHGDHHRLDGRPTTLRIDGDGAHLVFTVGGREHPVDALTLMVLTACGRLVPHHPRTPPRRGPRSRSRSGGGDA